MGKKEKGEETSSLPRSDSGGACPEVQREMVGVLVVRLPERAKKHKKEIKYIDSWGMRTEEKAWKHMEALIAELYATEAVPISDDQPQLD